MVFSNLRGNDGPKFQSRKMIQKMFCGELDTEWKVFWKPNSNHSLSFTVLKFFSILENWWCHQKDLVVFKHFLSCELNIFRQKHDSLNLSLELKNPFNTLFKNQFWWRFGHYSTFSKTLSNLALNQNSCFSRIIRSKKHFFCSFESPEYGEVNQSEGRIELHCFPQRPSERI